MTQEQKQQVESIGKRLKELLPEFTGNITFSLSATKDDIKYRIEQSGVVK
jgi:uncharacterized FlaG/YvyC family protein